MEDGAPKPLVIDGLQYCDGSETRAAHEAAQRPPLALRPPGRVMRLERLGSFHQTRISFMRSLLRRLVREGWSIARTRLDLDDQGYGHAVYGVETPGGRYALVAFSHALAPEERTDRVIAEKWDATFALVAGEVDDAAIARLAANVPRQEAGRLSPRELVLSRANKSVRLFDRVVASLAAGRQPDLAALGEVGYLMRTTAVYGNGKFGLADLARVQQDPLFRRPFQAEMLTVYLIRQFTVDLVEHIAARRSPARAVRLAPAARRALGIGNATGLGMAPFLVGHPALIHRWIFARELAIARVRAVERAQPPEVARFLALLERAGRHVGQWRTGDARQAGRVATLRAELQALAEGLRRSDAAALHIARPWDALLRRAEAEWSLEMQELLAGLILEPYGERVDDLEERMTVDERPRVDPAMSLEALAHLLRAAYGWALDLDLAAPDALHHFWYRSAEKEEPRLGRRGGEPGIEREMRIGVARDVQGLWQRLHRLDGQARRQPVAAFLLREPEWRHIVKRVQTLAALPYAEIRENLLDRACVPVDMLRCKLSFFGAVRFDPKSDRWTRITLYQGAPYPDELTAQSADDWAFPVVPEA